MTADLSFLNRVAARIGEPPRRPDQGVRTSMIAAAAAAYGSRPLSDELTHPTGFDPCAAAFFHAVVEAAHLVATADGDFDETERAAFRHVVLTACGGRVVGQQIVDLIAELEALKQAEGVEKRLGQLAQMVRRADHAREVLRVASLMAHVSGGVSAVERDVLAKMTAALGLDAAELLTALRDAEKALGK